MEFVWKDDLWSSSTMSSLTYQVLMASRGAVQTGYAEDFGDGLNIYLNRIAERYLTPPTIDFTSGVTYHPGAMDTFTLTNYDTMQGLKMADYVFGYCGNFTPYISNPVNGKADPRMKILWSFANASGSTINITIDTQ